MEIVSDVHHRRMRIYDLGNMVLPLLWIAEGEVDKDLLQGIDEWVSWKPLH